MFTYNSFLYVERNKRHLSRRKMAKLLHIGRFNYLMIEEGYFKPTKKQIQKISEALEVNYDEYNQNELSYPVELPEKKKNKLVQLFYKILGHPSFKIVFAIFTLSSLAFMIFGFAESNDISKHQERYYCDEYVEFVDRLRENGQTHISVVNDLMSPEYRTYQKDDMTNESKYISVVGSYKNLSLDFSAFYRFDNYRLLYEITPNEDFGLIISATLTNNETIQTYSAILIPLETDHLIIYVNHTDEKGNKNIYSTGSEIYDTYAPLILKYSNQYKEDFNNLLSSKDPLFEVESNQYLDELLSMEIDGDNKIETPLIVSEFGKYSGIVLTGLNLFILIFAFIYGTRKGVEKDYRPAQISVQIDEINRLKKDTKLMPFIPETLLEIVGIFMVFFGSFRLIYYAIAFSSGNASLVVGNSSVSSLMQIFVTGMFLLYFIDFDIFLDDKRVFRNIFLYSIIFFCLYGIECLIHNLLVDGSILGEFLSMIKIPNMFGSIACYYLIMFFLFYTPNRIKKKSTLIIYRCCSIIPTLIILISWFIYNGYNVIYEANWPYPVLNLFNGEKISFSILAITYLFGLYFLRLTFEHRLGKERASLFFNGNKFIWIKNGMVCFIILLIGAGELIFANNFTANKLGIGLYWNVLFLIPLLMFYHPHKGPRNIVLDWFTLGLYFIAISLSYVLTVYIVLLSII